MNRAAVKSCASWPLALALFFNCGCIDWDSLRASADAMIVADAGGDSPTELDKDVDRDLLVEWNFSQLAGGVVADVASRAPDVPLNLLPSGGAGGYTLEDKSLLLRDDVLESKATAARALGDAVAAAGGGLTVEFWLRDPALDEGFLLGLGTGAFTVWLKDGVLWAEVNTSLGTIDIAYPPSHSLGGTWHQVAVTYRPGLALVTAYFDGASVALAGDGMADATSRLVLWTAETERMGTFLVGDPDLGSVRFAFGAIFARELTGDDIKRRYNIGLSRL